MFVSPNAPNLNQLTITVIMKRTCIFVSIALVVIFSVGYLERAKIREISATLLRKIAPSLVEIHTTEVRFLSGNLRLHGTLYTPAWSLGQIPGIVVCHGGTSLGRHLALYVVLANKLAEQGYAVLTFDFRGFGESEDPKRYDTFSDLDFVHDVSSALTYLVGVKQVDQARLAVVGHSFGAGVAVCAGIRDPRVSKVVSIAPGRLTKQRFFGDNATDPDMPQIRMSNDMKIAPHIPKAVFYPHLIDYIAEAILDFPQHPPILLIDGAHEPQEELAFLQDVYEKMTEPKAYRTISEADHYFGTKRDQPGVAGNLAYDQSIMGELVDAIDTWLQE